MRKVKSNRGSNIFLLLIRNKCQKQNIAFSADLVKQKFVESWGGLFSIDFKIVIFVVFWLPQDFICHRSKIVSECLYDFLVVVELKTLQIGHVNENVIVYLYPEMATFLYEYSKGRLLSSELLN